MIEKWGIAKYNPLARGEPGILEHGFWTLNWFDHREAQGVIGRRAFWLLLFMMHK